MCSRAQDGRSLRGVPDGGGSSCGGRKGEGCGVKMRSLAYLELSSLRVLLYSLNASFRGKAAALRVSPTCLRNALRGGKMQAAKLLELFAAMRDARTWAPRSARRIRFMAHVEKETMVGR